MSSSGSVTAWLGQLQAGEETALAKLHQRYWPRLVVLARARLKGVPGRAADEEDVAQEAFWSFYRRLRAGRDFQLGSRHDLLALLTHIIACKAVNQIEHEYGVAKRGGGRVVEASALASSAGAGGAGLDWAASAEHTPLEQAILNDCYHRYVGDLPEHLRPFAELYLAGCTHKDIAARMACVERTVERKLALILRRWQEMAAVGVTEPVGVPARKDSAP
jgi:DNA-directed RNA polymerase specialized sigma24 family protein